jgi:hypothetical protein
MRYPNTTNVGNDFRTPGKSAENCRTNFRATRLDLLDSCIPILPAGHIAKYTPNRFWTGLHFNAALVSPDFLFSKVHEKRIPQSTHA